MKVWQLFGVPVLTLGIAASATADIIYIGDAQQFANGLVGVAPLPGQTGSLEVNGGSIVDANGVLAAFGARDISAQDASAEIYVSGAGSAINVGSLGAAGGNAFLSLGGGGGQFTGAIDDGGRITITRDSVFDSASVSATLGTGSLDISGGGTLEVLNPEFVDSSFEGLIVGRSSASSTNEGEAFLTIDGEGSSVSVIGKSPSVLLGLSNTPTTGTSVGDGTITVLNGAELIVASTGTEAEDIEIVPGASAAAAGLAAVLLGSGDGSIGDLTVDGAGSTVIIEGAPGLLVVGSNVIPGATGAGDGYFSVTNDAIVTVTGSDPGTSDFYVGLGGGNGEALIESGGQVIVDGIVGVSVDSSADGTFYGTDHTGQLLVNGTGSLTAIETTVGVGGLLGGTGTFNTNVVVDGGTFAPGLSPGTATVNGDFTLQDGSLVIEIAGLTSGLFDVLVVNGDANFFGGEILFDFIDGFLPSTGDIVDFLVADSIFIDSLVSFSFGGAAAGFDFQVNNEGGALSFVALTNATVPEPGTFGLLGLGLLGLGFARRKRA